MLRRLNIAAGCWICGCEFQRELWRTMLQRGLTGKMCFSTRLEFYDVIPHIFIQKAFF